MCGVIVLLEISFGSLVVRRMVLAIVGEKYMWGPEVRMEGLGIVERGCDPGGGIHVVFLVWSRW